jgi:bifunctional DNase/RNase
MREMQIYALTIDPNSKMPVVILRSDDDATVLPIWVGAMEAMAISLVLNKETLPRPLTHDLFVTVLGSLGARVKHIEITDYKEGIYYAILVLQSPAGSGRIDCRPSDAIALALRAGAPIMVSEAVLRQCAENAEAAHEDASMNPMQHSDAATDMMRQMGARREADALKEKLLQDGSLAPTEDEEEYRELLKSLEPESERKM